MKRDFFPVFQEHFIIIIHIIRIIHYYIIATKRRFRPIFLKKDNVR